MVPRLMNGYGLQSGAIETLVKVLLGSNLSAAAQAAGALWSLCVDNDHNKKLVANAGAVPFLVQVPTCDLMCLSLGPGCRGCMLEFQWQ